MRDWSWDTWVLQKMWPKLWFKCLHVPFIEIIISKDLETTKSLDGYSLWEDWILEGVFLKSCHSIYYKKILLLLLGGFALQLKVTKYGKNKLKEHQKCRKSHIWCNKSGIKYSYCRLKHVFGIYNLLKSLRRKPPNCKKLLKVAKNSNGTKFLSKPC